MPCFQTLPRKKALADEEKYRGDVLGLQRLQMDESRRFSEDQLNEQERQGTISSAVGLGNLALSAKQGADRTKSTKEILDVVHGGGGTAQSGTIKPEIDIAKDTVMEPGSYATPTVTGGSTDFLTGLKEGASKWGDIATGALAGGAIGSELASKAFGKNTTTKVLGGAAGAGLLSYLSSGDPYTAGISAIFGGTLGGFL